MLVSAVTLGVVLLIDLFLVGTLRRFGASIVVAAYEGKAPMLVQWIFSRVATDAHKTGAGAYLAKYLSLFTNLRLGISIVVAFIGLAGIGRALPTVADRLGNLSHGSGGCRIAGLRRHVRPDDLHPPTRRLRWSSGHSVFAHTLRDKRNFPDLRVLGDGGRGGVCFLALSMARSSRQVHR